LQRVWGLYMGKGLVSSVQGIGRQGSLQMEGYF
jgi:hypothetical protein